MGKQNSKQILLIAMIIAAVLKKSPSGKEEWHFVQRAQYKY